MFQMYTFDVVNNEEELAVLSTALDMLQKKQYTEATKILIERHDKLMEKPTVKIYDPRVA